MGDPDPSRYYLEVHFDMKEKVNNPVWLGNNKVCVYSSYAHRKVEFDIPKHVRRSPFRNKVAMSKGVIYVNGYRLNQEKKTWHRSFKGWLINLIL